MLELEEELEVDESRLDDAEWLAQQFEGLTTELTPVTPSQWAESNRYLPPSVAAMPGFYRFSVTPYLREIVDCFGVDSPIREVTIQKGVQIGATVGVLENVIGYYIAHVKTAPMMFVTADAELAKLRLESNITPMIQQSGLEHLIKSTDEKNTRKTGKTDKKIEWSGGGYLVPFGAINANKLRSLSIQVMLRDEIDGWPDIVGKDGDPIKLSADRTNGYKVSYKIGDISTPLIKGQSKVEKRFLQGDQRHYFVCCLECGHPQSLRWQRTNPDTGEVTGITWEMGGDRLVPGSVRYRCERCGHPHTNDDKVRLLSPEHGAEWRPTAIPQNPTHRSYHLSALYSPVGMQSWEDCVRMWLTAWDVANNRVKDSGALQVFYNNVLGETYEVRGEKLRFVQVSGHRRQAFRYGEVPNGFAGEFCASPIVLLTCAVDVQGDNLAVAVFGWTAGRRSFLVDYWRFKGDTQQLDDPGTWGELRKLVESKQYVADDGKRYGIALTLVDSGYRADDVYQFCSEYEAGVIPIKGRDTETKRSLLKEFTEFKTPMGQIAYHITVDLYKDRCHSQLRRGWDRMSLLPDGHFNAPVDATDDQLKELTKETKRQKVDKTTGKSLGYFWHRPSGAKNELWDLMVYNTAALDLIGWNFMVGQMERENVTWSEFFEIALRDKMFFEDGPR